MFKTQDGEAIAVKEHTYDTYIPILEKIHPGFEQIIQMIPAHLRPPVYVASYQYGTQIIDGNGIYLPLTNGGNISFNDTRLPNRLTEGLSFDPHSSCPVGVILNKNCEYYAEADEERIVPHTLLRPGESIGLNWALKNAIKLRQDPDSGPTFLWDLTAGVRSIFLLSKVADRPQHKKLQKLYGINADVPTRYQDQWFVFKDLAHKAKSPWRAEILFFDNKWFELLKDRQYGPHLYMWLSAINERTSRIWHHMPSWDKTYGQIELKKTLSAYPTDILYTAKHLFAITAICAPAFRPGINDNSAPIGLFKEAYIKGYNLEHCATIMEVCLFDETDSVYYSVNYSTSAQYSHPGRRVIDSLYKIKDVVDFFQTSIQTAQGIRAKSLLNVVSNVNLSYFHDNPGDYNNIKNSMLVAEEDRRFINGKKCNFPYHSSFLIGLIKITPQKS